MTVTQQDLGISRPPPNPRQTIRFYTPGIPWYRDLRVLRILAQIVFLILFLGGLYILVDNLLRNLEASNLTLNFGVYRRPFNVAVSEGISITQEWTWINNLDVLTGVVVIVWGLLLVGMGYIAFRQYRGGGVPVWTIGLCAALMVGIVLYTPDQAAEDLSVTLNAYFFPSSMARAFVTGIYNTLRVVALTLIASTLLGVLAGVGLLSKNVLVRGVAKVYVEVFRNTPLVVQLFFIYRTFTLVLPAPRQSIYSPNQIGPIKLENSLYIFNARGFYFAEPIPKDSAAIFYIAVVLALALGWFIRRRRIALQERTGRPANTWRIILPIMFVVSAIGWMLAGGPFTIEYPALQGLNVQGGTQLTIGFVSLFAGLTLYTSAFIAEIVRAGIQAVPYGQIEAARSQGLSNSQVLNLVVLPQALRLIIPPLGNQYVNMGKNSSLGLIVNYVDTYRIAQLANNESGQAVPFFVGLMVIYLTLSLTLSVMTNFINRSTQIKAR